MYYFIYSPTNIELLPAVLLISAGVGDPVLIRQTLPGLHKSYGETCHSPRISLSLSASSGRPTWWGPWSASLQLRDVSSTFPGVTPTSEVFSYCLTPCGLHSTPPAILGECTASCFTFSRQSWTGTCCSIPTTDLSISTSPPVSVLSALLGRLGCRCSPFYWFLLNSRYFFSVFSHFILKIKSLTMC